MCNFFLGRGDFGLLVGRGRVYVDCLFSTYTICKTLPYDGLLGRVLENGGRARGHRPYKTMISSGSQAPAWEPVSRGSASNTLQNDEETAMPCPYPK